MRNNIVLLTYPGHFLLSKLAIESIKKISPQSNITVIADNISNLTWNGYIDDCKVFYGVEVIPTNQTLNLLTMFKGDGWLRQQMIKLYIDTVVDFDEFFITDGDVEFLEQLPDNKFTPCYVTKWIGEPLTVQEPGPGDVSSQQAKYLEYILKIPYQPLNVEMPIRMTSELCVATSGVPFRDIDKWTLNELRSYVSKLHCNDFLEIHKNIQFDTRFSVSEWELIEQFKEKILNQTPISFYCPPQPSGSNKGIFTTCFLSDKQMTKEWWMSRNIDIEFIWDKLPNKK